jgi:hypothetical protein
MNETEFHNLLDRFGADLSQWPADRCLTAERAMADDPSLTDLLAAEQLLASCLPDLPPAATASVELRQRIMALPLAHPHPLPSPGMLSELWRSMTASWRQWSMGMATASAAAVLGFVLGYGQMLPPVTGEQAATSDDLVTMLNAAADYDTAETEQAQ